MIAFVLRRLLGMVTSLLILATLTFFLLRAVPGGPFDAERAVSAQVQTALEAKYQLDTPLWRQYVHWVGDLLSGDLGPTLRYPGRSVGELIGDSLPVSLELGLGAALFAFVFGLPLGLLSALRPRGWLDAFARTAALLGISVPRFVLAPVLIFVFSLGLYWFPVARWESARHMVLPVVCTGLPLGAYVARLCRTGMMDVLGADFIRAAQAKGLSERQVITRHALRAGLLPLLSFLGPALSGMLVGSVVVESIFDIPGMGRYFVEAAINRDYNLVMGVTLIYGSLLMVFNALVDGAYQLLDPRLRDGRGQP